MTRPEISDEQRIVAVTMLANAIRKEQYLRQRTAAGNGGDSPLRAIGSRHRQAASELYVRGMRDLLAVLFDGGRAVADACFESALALANGGEQSG